jgi:hypothetical protein
MTSKHMEDKLKQWRYLCISNRMTQIQNTKTPAGAKKMECRASHLAIRMQTDTATLKNWAISSELHLLLPHVSGTVLLGVYLKA